MPQGVCHGKGGKDRYTLLSPRLLAALRTYWRDTRPQRWLFGNRTGSGPMEIQTAQRIYYAATSSLSAQSTRSHTLASSRAVIE